MRSAVVVALAGLLVLGCAGTQDHLKKQGVEVRPDRVLRVYRF